VRQVILNSVHDCYGYYGFYGIYIPLIHSLIHSGHFCTPSSSPLLLRSAPDTARILCPSFTPKRNRQLWVKDLP